MTSVAERMRDAADARQAQVEAHANEILRDLGNYEDLIGRIAESEPVQEALHDLANMPDALVILAPEQKILDALRAAAAEKAREELS